MSSSMAMQQRKKWSGDRAQSYAEAIMRQKEKQRIKQKPTYSGDDGYRGTCLRQGETLAGV